ncbi:transposase [Streptomyces sp. NPDC035033]|uniref:transposase n=1 Tax=Streptomyces sp. NPDC035033 TaxID=3155368 RepID=UPI0033C98043
MLTRPHAPGRLAADRCPARARRPASVGPKALAGSDQYSNFDRIMGRMAGRFGQVEPRATARAYLLGLLSGVERKNCWGRAEQVGHARPGPMRRLLRTARWDADAVRDEVRVHALARLGSDGGVLIAAALDAEVEAP